MNARCHCDFNWQHSVTFGDDGPVGGLASDRRALLHGGGCLLSRRMFLSVQAPWRGIGPGTGPHIRRDGQVRHSDLAIEPVLTQLLASTAPRAGVDLFLVGDLQFTTRHWATTEPFRAAWAWRRWLPQGRFSGATCRRDSPSGRSIGKLPVVGPGDAARRCERKAAEHGACRVRAVERGLHLGHLATAPSRHSCDLLLKASRGVTIAVISARQRKRRQPGLATDDPAFVGWHQLVRGIQGSQVHFDFVRGAGENGRAAAGTEKPSGIVACFAIDRHRVLREHRGSMEESAMMLATVETVTKADPVRESRRHDADVAAQATARESVHAASPLNRHSPMGAFDTGNAAPRLLLGQGKGMSDGGGSLAPLRHRARRTTMLPG